MRLVIKDYLMQLKEKDELDLLLCDLLLQRGYITDNKPETGNRQFGVDIHAHNKNEVLLCVVKQGDLDRKNWDSNQNSVRQSLNEIKDVYVEWIKGGEREKKLRIAVVSNGVIKEAVKPAWEGYVSQNIRWSEMEVKIEFWNIDRLVEDIQKYLFGERIFGVEMQGLLRKALYFIGEGNYSNKYFEEIIDLYLMQLEGEQNAKKRKKVLAGIYLASQMIAQYAAESNIYKISIMVSEYLIIRYWKFMMKNNVLGRSAYADWLYKFLAAYEKWNNKYYENIKRCCEMENGLPVYNPIEQRVLLYEVLGYLVSYAYYLSFMSGGKVATGEKCWQVVGTIVNLINNHAQFPYAPYDQHVGIISMLYRLLDCIGRSKDIEALLDSQCECLAHLYRRNKQYPTAIDSFEDAVNIYLGTSKEEYVTTGFWGTMLQWMVLMEQSETYQNLQAFLSKDLEEVTKCTWFLREEEEAKFYDRYAMNLAGEGVEIEIEDDFNKLKENIEFIMSQYSDEKFSFEEYSFEALEFIVSRYYGYIVRAKREL